MLPITALSNQTTDVASAVGLSFEKIGFVNFDACILEEASYKGIVRVCQIERWYVTLQVGNPERMDVNV